MTLFTIGYEKKNIEEYIAILKKYNVNAVIDVRETAWSHKRDFCKKKFSELLSMNEIEYVHLKSLGNPKQFRNGETDPSIVLKKYGKYLDETKAGISELSELISSFRKLDKNLCLTCFEKDYKECHRSIIASFIKKKIKINITHL